MTTQRMPIPIQGRKRESAMTDGHQRVLIVDDDAGVREILSILLSDEGFQVAVASNGREALNRAVELLPDVVLLDIMMPDLDGLEVCRELRAHPKTRYVCILLVTARAASADKVAGLRAGADDFVTKPFDPSELVERVRTALRRGQDMASLNPLTRLPGNQEIQRVIESKLATNRHLALMHFDIDNFKGFNDHYGLQRGDAAIRLLGDCLTVAVETVEEGAFVGHTGGDDMVAVVRPDAAEAIAIETIQRWERSVADLYDTDDLVRGFIEGIDRNGRRRRFPVMALSIGIAMTEKRDVMTQWQISDIASSMKNIAKRTAASSYELDRREGELRVTEIVSDSELEYGLDHHKVLVVDDNPMIRELLVMYCEQKGFAVLEASDGVEAYQMTVQHHPAYVVLDFRMPQLNGRYAAELIRGVAPKVTIIALSAFLDSKPEWADAFIDKDKLHELPEILSMLASKQTKFPSNNGAE